jgi:hypothetical protein
MAITITVWKFMFRKHSLRVAALMLCAVSATAAAMDRGQFKNVPPEIREWFENMRSPMGFRVALTLMVTALATTLGRVNIGFP